MTDDRSKVPARYRNKVKKRELGGEGARAVKGAEPKPRQPPAAAQQPLPGGHGQEWWRKRFASLRAEVLALQDLLQAKQGKLTELRRKRTIYQKARDREAINAMEADISADEKRLNELINQLAALDQQASRDAVPLEWRR